MELSVLNQIRNLIAESNLKEALEHLQELLQGSILLDEVILQSARYNSLMREIRMGTLDYEKVNINKSKIISAVIDMINILEEKCGSEEKVRKELIKKPKSSYLTIARIKGKNGIEIKSEQKNSSANFTDFKTDGNIKIDIKQK